MKLIILTAGKGLRFSPLTETIPKGMVPILGEPLLKHVVAPYLEYISDIIFVVNSGLGMQIKKYFGKSYQGHKVFYKIQLEQKGTMDALMTCKDLIQEGEMFCVCNGDDLLKDSNIGNVMNDKIIGVGISKKVMPKSYLGVLVENEHIVGFVRHDENKDLIEDNYCNGFNILDSRVFDFIPITTRDGELGLPHTLFANIDKYPLKAFDFMSWETVNKPSDIKDAEKFIKGLK